jgi:hypothetical protein
MVVRPAHSWREALRRGAIDGVFVARPDGDNLQGDVVELAVDKSEPLRPLTRDVELDSGKPGQVAADVWVAKLFADDASSARSSAIATAAATTSSP